MKTHYKDLEAWQKDPNNITTDTVQFWVNGIMITAQLTKEEAQQKLREGKAFVISEQAIGSVTPKGELNS